MAQRTFNISASVESSLHFHSKTFSAKLIASTGRQTDHLCWDLGSPGGLMGRIRRPGDRISAALLTVMTTTILQHPSILLTV